MNNISKSTTPFDVVHIDYYGPVDNESTLKHILVVIDASTKFVRLYATKTKEVVKHLRNYFRAIPQPSKVYCELQGNCIYFGEVPRYSQGTWRSTCKGCNGFASSQRTAEKG